MPSIDHTSRPLTIPEVMPKVPPLIAQLLNTTHITWIQLWPQNMPTTQVHQEKRHNLPKVQQY